MLSINKCGWQALFRRAKLEVTVFRAIVSPHKKNKPSKKLGLLFGGDNKTRLTAIADRVHRRCNRVQCDASVACSHSVSSPVTSAN